MPNALIQCQNLKKSFGSTEVLKSVDFEVVPGRLVGFLGPNGAGKTTTIRILMGLLSSTSGIANMFGKSSSLHGKSIRQQVGYLPGDVHLYSNLSGRRLLEFFAKARRQDCRDEIERLSSVLELELNKRVRKYSTGMKQKLGLIQALMHRPQLLILDEPTSALDPLIRKVVFDELKAVVKEGRTIFFSSHSLSEVETLCDEVVIIRAGRVVEQQSVAQLQDKAIRKIKIQSKTGQELPSELPTAFETIRRDDNELVGTWSGEINELTQWLAGQAISDLIVEKPDLNDLFLSFYESAASDKTETRDEKEKP